MSYRLATCAALTIALLAPGHAAVTAAPGSNETLQEKGRYKLQGDDCVWDANDSGPNQCTPRTRGRFKQDGGSCVWVANDDGPDQCKPPSGRWKTEGDRCVWDAKDSGPNQCNPRRPRQ